MWVCRSIFIQKSKRPTFNVQHPTSKSEKIPLLFLLLLLIEFLKQFHWLRFFDLLAALLAGTTRIVIPEIEHRLTEMLDDVCAVEMDVFHQCSAVLAVKNNVLFFSRRTAPFHHDSNRIR